MSTYGKLRSRRQRRHPDSRSRSHQEDKRQGEARRQTRWVPVSAPQHPSPRRSFGQLEGHEYRFDGEHWWRCNLPEEFADYLEREARKRDFYRSRTRRNGVEVDMRRPATPLENLTTTFAPWLSDWTAAEIAAKRDPRTRLAAIRNGWLEAVEAKLSAHRYILGYALHADTDDLHFDLILSRQDGLGVRIGQTGLRLAGPWCVGVDRQLRAGAQINGEKRSQLRRSVANFRHRYGGDAVPLDVQLARALDAAAEQVLGDELTPYREAYARRVPELERQHAAAELAALKAAETALRNRTLSTVESDFPPLG
jgi:hypothetical protein